MRENGKEVQLYIQRGYLNGFVSTAIDERMAHLEDSQDATGAPTEHVAENVGGNVTQQQPISGAHIQSEAESSIEMPELRITEAEFEEKRRIALEKLKSYSPDK